MGHVIDVAEQGEDATVLTDTGSGGLLGGRLLHDAPLGTHLNDVERAQYVLHNKNEGIRVERDGDTEQVAPDGDYRALAAVTDVRIRFVIGRADGDVTYSVPLVDVVDVGSDDGVVTSSLWVATEEARYEFSCRGELERIAAAIDGNAQATVRAYRLHDEARDSLAAADEHLAADRFEAALDAVEAANERLRTARERLGEVGDGALAAFDADNAETRRRIRDLPRTIHGVYAWSTHSEAKSAWAETEYERAHDRYETAIAAYRNARKSPGEKPTDDELAEQREAARTERDELRRAPLANAQQVAHGAASIDGPAPAAERWERAIRRYQDVLWLDWGRDERRFDGDPEAVREAIVDAVDNLVTERRAATRACRDAAQVHQMSGATDAARSAYRTALSHVERAQSIVDEIAPNRETGLDDTKAAVEEALASVPENGTGASLRREERSGDAPEANGDDYRSLIAEHWTRHGWAIERDDGDLVATTERPLELRAFVRVADAQTGTTPQAVEDCAEMARFVDADLAVLATDDDPGPVVRERAQECDVHLQDLQDLRDGIRPSPSSVTSA